MSVSEEDTVLLKSNLVMVLSFSLYPVHDYHHRPINNNNSTNNIKESAAKIQSI